MIEKKPGVYCIKNVVDGKVYIGISINVYIRVKNHINNLNKRKHHNKHLQRAFIKNGAENFIFYVLEYCKRQELNDREVYHISSHKAIDDEFGYNIVEGGSLGANVSEKDKITLREIKKDLSIRVYGFNIKGDFVKEWSSISYCAIDLKVSPCDIRRTINQNQRHCRGLVLNNEPVFRLRESNRGGHLKQLNLKHPKHIKPHFELL